MQRDSVGGTLAVAAILCIVCSLVVSAATVILRPMQEINKKAFEKQNILLAAGVFDKSKPVDDQFELVETRIIELGTNNYAEEGAVDPEKYDQRSAAKKTELSVKIESSKDIAGIKRREKYGRVFIFKDKDGKVTQIVMPVYGKGLWSTLYGFLAIDGDFKTSAGLTFYEHKETPGLGGEIDSEKFKAAWRKVAKTVATPATDTAPAIEATEGRSLQLLEDDGTVVVEVTKGAAIYPSRQVDGLSGATITSRGVSNLVRYWLSDEGYGLFLKSMKEGESDG
jgi:Na+-transporting NADH:ubiquinone oxidoreductase subunit C